MERTAKVLGLEDLEPVTVPEMPDPDEPVQPDPVHAWLEDNRFLYPNDVMVGCSNYMNFTCAYKVNFPSLAGAGYVAEG
jgi:hypothetical protein